MTDMVEARGRIIRVASDDLGYILLDESDRIVSFNRASLITPPATRRLEKSVVGRLAEVRMLGSSGEVLEVRVEAASALVVRGDELGLPRPEPAESATSQLELHPEQEAAGRVKTERALPLDTRAFGKLVNTGALLPGDLLLSRDLTPDKISGMISDVQQQGGYNLVHAQWTHAAMYVGDGMHVVEATFDSLMSGGDVRLTVLDEYSTGNYVVRFRRPLGLSNDQERWRLCVRAMSRLTRKYDFMDAARMWFRVMIQKHGFWDDNRKSAVSSAVICSTLYADSFNEATRRSLGEIGGVCVPAWLSGSNQFEDINVGWLSVN